MNRFDRAIEHIKKRLGSQTTGAGIEIAYHRGSDSVTIPNVWLGRQLFRVQDYENSRVEWSDRDFLIPIESLILDGSIVQPQRGDYIIVTFPEPYGQQKFEVSAPNNERPWRFSDQQGRLYRVHTKRVKL